MGEMAPLVRRKRLDLVLETLQGKLELHHVGSELILCSGVTPGSTQGYIGSASDQIKVNGMQVNIFLPVLYLQSRKIL